MKIKTILLLALAAIFTLAAPRPAHARAEVSFDFFYDSLAPYGEWLDVGDYGYCWHPSGVDAGWTPYSDGYWTFTDAGWTWVGYEEFSGIVYHYGRWVLVEREGWCWKPDYEWGPAWVSWRHSDRHIGWAPLPPAARWHRETGFSTWVDASYDIGPDYYNFCETRNFGAPVLRPVIIDRSRNVTIIRNTVNITNITYNNSYGDEPIVYNGGPSYAVINERSQRRIPTLKLVRNTNIDITNFNGGGRGDRFNAQPIGNQLVVAAPFVAAPVEGRFAKEKVRRVAQPEVANTGWAGVKDPEARRELKQQFARENKGRTPETAPAKPVAAAELKVLPARGDPNAPSQVGNGRGRNGDVPAPENAAREKGRGKTEGAPAVADAPITRGTPPNEPARTRTENGAPANPIATTPEGAKTPGSRGEKKRGKNGKENAATGVAVTPPAAEPTRRGPVAEVPATGVNPEGTRNPNDRVPKKNQPGSKDGTRDPVVDGNVPTGRNERGAAAEADASKERATQQRRGEAAAAGQRKQSEAQPQPEAARQGEGGRQRQQMEAAGAERQRQKSEGAQRGAQERQQTERAAEAQRQQAAAAQKQLQEQSPAGEGRRAQEAQRDQFSRQQQAETKAQAATARQQQEAPAQRGAPAQPRGRGQAEAQQQAQPAGRGQPPAPEAQPGRGAPQNNGHRGDKNTDKDKDPNAPR